MKALEVLSTLCGLVAATFALVSIVYTGQLFAAIYTDLQETQKAVAVQRQTAAEAKMVEEVLRATKDQDYVPLGNQFSDKLLVLDSERQWSNAVTPYYVEVESADVNVTYERHECKMENVTNPLLRKAFQC